MCTKFALLPFSAHLRSFYFVSNVIRRVNRREKKVAAGVLSITNEQPRRDFSARSLFELIDRQTDTNFAQPNFLSTPTRSFWLPDNLHNFAGKIKGRFMEQMAIKLAKKHDQFNGSL